MLQQRHLSAVFWHLWCPRNNMVITRNWNRYIHHEPPAWFGPQRSTGCPPLILCRCLCVTDSHIIDQPLSNYISKNENNVQLEIITTAALAGLYLSNTNTFNIWDIVNYFSVVLLVFLYCLKYLSLVPWNCN